MKGRVAVGVTTLLLLVACKRKPCDVGRYAVDTRPLPDDWAKAMATPPGAAMCFDSFDRPKRFSGGYFRIYDVRAKTGEEAHEAWRAALEGRGWVKTPATRRRNEYDSTPDPCQIDDRFDHGELTLHLQIDRCSKKIPGWTGATLERRATGAP
jgi:hypothetical protein